MTPSRFAVRADLLDFPAAPTWLSTADDGGNGGVRWRPDHWLLVDGGRIAGAVPGAAPPGEDWPKLDQRGRLLLPGFVDTHVHGPQLDVIASHGTGLLDWLATYTFPAEQRFADPDLAHAGAARFCDALLAHGTTSALAFATVHRVAAEALFEAAAARGMALATGKVLMDRNAPDALRDDVDGARADCEALIDRWHRRGRARYAVTVRFAATSSPEQLAMAGALCARHGAGAPGGVLMQTHVAENTDEVAWIAQLFPQARSYLDVYRTHGLLFPGAVLAHGIWLDDADRALLRDSGAAIAHCPTSNLFLGSGLFDWAAAVDAGHRVSLASDVGGGTSLSMLRTAAAAYTVQALRGTRLSAWTLLHAATLAGAGDLGLADEIGHLGDGAVADLALWDWAADGAPGGGGVAAHRDAVARGCEPGLAAQPLHARVFAWLMQADERNLAGCWVAGRTVREPAPRPPPSPRGTASWGTASC